MVHNDKESEASADSSPSRMEERKVSDLDRIMAIRQKILDGAYDSLDTVEQVARRLLSSGDL